MHAQHQHASIVNFPHSSHARCQQCSDFVMLQAARTCLVCLVRWPWLVSARSQLPLWHSACFACISLLSLLLAAAAKAVSSQIRCSWALCILVGHSSVSLNVVCVNLLLKAPCIVSKVMCGDRWRALKRWSEPLCMWTTRCVQSLSIR